MFLLSIHNSTSARALSKAEGARVCLIEMVLVRSKMFGIWYLKVI